MMRSLLGDPYTQLLLIVMAILLAGELICVHLTNTQGSNGVAEETAQNA